MSCIGTPWRYASATPSPVRLQALDVIRNIRPKPPVASSTAFERQRDELAVRDAVGHDARRPPAGAQVAALGDQVHDVVLVVELDAVLDALLVERLEDHVARCGRPRSRPA